jgi:hypothetical protein
MGQNVRVSEQYLSQIATDLRTRMSEIKELREAIQSAEDAKDLHQSAAADLLLPVRGWVLFR